MNLPIQFHVHIPQLPIINRVIKFFILADLTFLAGWGLINPIFAIFVISNIEGATLMTIGTVAAIYWVTKSVVQLPIAWFLDKNEGEKDDFYALIIGLLVAALAMFSLMAASQVWHVYLIEFVKAIAFAFYVPAWSAIFSRHLDKGRTAFDWALAGTAVGASMGVAGFVGAWLAKISFLWVFLFGGFLALVSAIILLLVPNLILPPKQNVAPETLLRDHHINPVQR